MTQTILRYRALVPITDTRIAKPAFTVATEKDYAISVWEVLDANSRSIAANTTRTPEIAYRILPFMPATFAITVIIPKVASAQTASRNLQFSVLPRIRAWKERTTLRLACCMQAFGTIIARRVA